MNHLQATHLQLILKKNEKIQDYKRDNCSTIRNTTLLVQQSY